MNLQAVPRYHFFSQKNRQTVVLRASQPTVPRNQMFFRHRVQICISRLNKKKRRTQKSLSPWSKSSPKGPDVPVRLACLPSIASRLWYIHIPIAKLPLSDTHINIIAKPLGASETKKWNKKTWWFTLDRAAHSDSSCLQSHQGSTWAYERDQRLNLSSSKSYLVQRVGPMLHP